MVNVAYDAAVDRRRRRRSRTPRSACSSSPRSGHYDTGFHAFETALLTAIDMASAAYKRDGHLSGLATGLEDLDRLMGGLQASDLVILAGRPGMGKTALATNIAFNVAKAWRGEVQPDGSMKTVDGGIVGFFSLEMSSEQLATRIIAEQIGRAVGQHPPRSHRRSAISPTSSRRRARCRRSRSTSTRPAA